MIGRWLLALLAFMAASPALAEGCRVSSGVDYSFERLEATRVVNDAHDRGTITLVAYVYRPLKQDRKAVVVYSHGSTGGFQFDPKEPQPIVHCSLKNYFLSRGYALVAFIRRGRGESTGTYVEECARYRDPSCTAAATRTMSDKALAEAVADGRSVLDQVVERRVARPGDRLVLAGHSRGAVLSFALAAERPQRVAAVLNFAGGWLGVQAGGEASDENRRRADYHSTLFRRLGGRYAGPSLWVYAADDPLYGASVTRPFLDSYTAGGGRGTLFMPVDHGLENGHLLVQESPIWAKAADALLDPILSAPAPR